MGTYKKFAIIVGVFILGMVMEAVLSRIPLGNRIAVLEVEGAITDPEFVVKSLERLKKDGSVKAVVLRVESPGGSIAASQEIFREIERFKESKKPVVVSMGNIAASGGYYISLPADYIMANEGTATGSIGVLIVHVSMKNLFSRWGIEVTSIKSGKLKDSLQPFKELTEEDKKYLKAVIEEAYEQFLKAVLKYRKGKVDEEKLREVADGRVILGSEALKLGLIDGIGNLEDAIEKAKELAKVKEARVFYLSPKKGILKRLLGSESLLMKPGLYYLAQF